jgi:hypothetical protein
MIRGKGDSDRVQESRAGTVCGRDEDIPHC